MLRISGVDYDPVDDATCPYRYRYAELRSQYWIYGGWGPERKNYEARAMRK